MKRIFVMVMVVALLASMTICFAENKVEEYAELMKGTWKVEKVLNNGLNGTNNLFNMPAFETFDLLEHGYLTGNEVGNVYYAADAGFGNICAEVTFSADKNTMMLLCTFDCTVVLKRQ